MALKVFSDVTFQAKDAEKRILVNDVFDRAAATRRIDRSFLLADEKFAAFVLGKIARSVVRCDQKTERVLARFSCHLRREVRIDDRTRIENGHW